MMDKFSTDVENKRKLWGEGVKKCDIQFLMYVTSIFMPSHEIFMFLVEKISSMTFVKIFRIFFPILHNSSYTYV